MDSSEVRVTNPKTGGQKGQKLARYDLIPPRAIEALAEHYGRGARKYADRNWEKGVDWSLSFAALQRHVWAWWNGEETDDEGNSHLAAAMWHVAALIEYGATHPELDDRPQPQSLKDWIWKDVFIETNKHRLAEVARQATDAERLFFHRVERPGDLPGHEARLINYSNFEWSNANREGWLTPAGRDADAMLDAEDEFDEDFLAYLDWRDGVDEPAAKVWGLPGGPRYLAWRDTR